MNAPAKATRERPLLSSGPLICEILADRKTQTRRLVKPQPEARDGGWYWRSPRYDNGDGVNYIHSGDEALRNLMPSACPYGARGDKLWVRETWAPAPGETCDPPELVWFRADNSLYCTEGRIDGEDERAIRRSWPARPLRWRPAIHMPRCLARIMLEVTSVRVERLREISEEDARAEGVEPDFGNAHTFASRDYRRSFEKLWDAINGKRASWESDPWVWVVGFRRLAP